MNIKPNQIKESAAILDTKRASLPFPPPVPHIKRFKKTPLSLPEIFSKKIIDKINVS